MRKQKTHKGLEKRIKITATGRVVRKRPGKSHLNSHKPGIKLQKLRRTVEITGKPAKRIRAALNVD